MPSIGQDAGPDPIFKGLIWDTVVSLLMKWLFSKVPFLAFGPIGAFVGFLLTPVFNELYRILWEVIDIPRIFIRSNSLRIEYEKSAFWLRRIATEQGGDSDEFKKALKEDQKRFFDFVSLGEPL